MARAYSMDLRERAVRLVNAGRTVRAVAALLNIAVSRVRVGFEPARRLVETYEIGIRWQKCFATQSSA